MFLPHRTKGRGADTISLHWGVDEVPRTCFSRRLCTKPGNIPVGQLPISREKQAITNALNRYPILGVKAEPAAGKSTQVPDLVRTEVRRWNPWTRPSLCLVQKSVYACRKVKDSLTKVFQWEGHRIQLKTVKDDEAFLSGQTELSIIDYGLLWQWLTTEPNLLRRYDALLLDDWADIGPKQREMGRMLRHMLQRESLPSNFRLVLMSALLQPVEVSELLGDDFGFVTVTGRNHTMERCVVMPPSKRELLATAAHLAIAVVQRRGPRAGDCIVFLPGIAEIAEVQYRIKTVARECKILILHSDCMGSADEEEIRDEAVAPDGMVVLSTIIGSRTVTLDTVRYVIIHPAVRTSRMHRSGIMKHVDSPITPELENSQEGRVARVSSGLATYLYDIDDTGLVLHRASQGQSSTYCRHSPPTGPNQVAIHLTCSTRHCYT